MPATTTTSPTTPVVVPPRSSTQTQRRVKIYCDKWVHEGICAFTQQGCKYKHEMPQDRATQHSLGLFHGLPAWWRKQQQGELARSSAVVGGLAGNQVSPPPTPGLRRFGVGGAGGNGVASVAGRFGQRSVTMGGGGPGPATAASWRAGARGVGGGLFGPIGPPPQAQGQLAMGTTTIATTQEMGQREKGSTAEELRLSMFPVGRVEERKEEEEKGKEGKETSDKDGENGKDEKDEE